MAPILAEAASIRSILSPNMILLCETEAYRRQAVLSNRTDGLFSIATSVASRHAEPRPTRRSNDIIAACHLKQSGFCHLIRFRCHPHGSADQQAKSFVDG
jgi:hypothetical protein